MSDTSRIKNTPSSAHAFGYRGNVHAHVGSHLAGAGLRILYVEDDDDVRETTRILLSGPGREVVAVATAEEALAMLAEQRCDLLFTDVNLPGLSGEALARHLLDSEPDHWVVLCSGNAIGREVRRWGAHVRVLPKLFRLEELDALLDEITRDVDDRRLGWS